MADSINFVDLILEKASDALTNEERLRMKQGASPTDEHTHILVNASITDTQASLI